MENGWSIKQLIREIVLSDTYQLAATFDETSYAKDPGNTTHWRVAPRQLDAEALRDQMLLVSGLLEWVRPDGSIAHQVGDSRLGGRGPGNATDSFDTAHFRGRSIYLPILRDALPDELGLFDFPDPQGTVGRRSPTNVAPQSLHLMNSELVYVQATSMARLLEKNFPSIRDQISNGYLLAYNRPATDSEVERALLFLGEFAPGDPPAAMSEAPSSVYSDEDSATAGRRGKGKEGKARGKTKGKGGARGSRASASPPSAKVEPSPMTPHQIKLAAFCQALMMSAEFRTIH